MSQIATAKAKPRRAPNSRQPLDADPVLSLAIRWARAIGMHLAVWLVRAFAIGLLPLQVFSTASIVFITSVISGFWQEAFAIRKERGTRLKVKNTAESAGSAQRTPHDDPIEP